MAQDKEGKRDILAWALNLTENSMGTIEAILVSIVGRVACWLAPLPSAVLVAQATAGLFDLANIWGVVIAAVLELIGLVTSNLWLNAKEWNLTKRSGDPPANQGMALGLMIVYFVTAFALLSAIEIPQAIQTRDFTGLTALLFPVISIVGVLALNERVVQWHRVKAVEEDRAKKKQEREERQEKREADKIAAQERAERLALLRESRSDSRTSKPRNGGKTETVELDKIILREGVSEDNAEFSVACPCGYVSGKGYDTRGKARMAAGAHRRTCDYPLDDVEGQLPPVGVSAVPPESNGDTDF